MSAKFPRGGAGPFLARSLSTKQGLMCLAQGHNAVTPVRLEPAALRFRVKHSTTELPIIHEYFSCCRYIRTFHECSCFNEFITRVGKKQRVKYIHKYKSTNVTFYLSFDLYSPSSLNKCNKNMSTHVRSSI